MRRRPIGCGVDGCSRSRPVGLLGVLVRAAEVREVVEAGTSRGLSPFGRRRR